MAKLSGLTQHAPGRLGRRRLRGAAAVLAAAATGLTLGATAAGPVAASPAAAVTARPQVRINQVGYAPRGPKLAFAMVAKRVGSVGFTVLGPRGVVFRGRSAAFAGRWNARYGAVYRLDFSRLNRPGRYRIRIQAGGATATSPSFRVAPSAALYHQLVLNAVRYFTSERDGADVVRSVLDRRPANLTDRRASVFKSPRFDGDDNLVGKFSKIGGPVNVAGGWFDAGGGYEKFAYTVSYAEGLMLMAARDFPGRYSTLPAETDFGLRWLERLWNPKKKVLYMQVGVGTGNASGSIQGDYNFWFLPQAEDHLNVSKGGKPGPSAYYVKYRPVFEAAPPGHKMDPDFAGRFAADFAMAAQIAAGRGHHGRAARGQAEQLLALARGLYAMARTSNVKSIITAYPHDFYPGTEWKSDMLWGAAEIALADEALHAPRHQVQADLAVAERWARAYLRQGHPKGGDTLNLYDNGALGEADLLAASRHHWSGLAPGALLGDLARQLQLGVQNSAGDPFRLGSSLGNSDATPHAFGLFITNALYQRYGGSDKYQAFAQQQLNFALGANPWGSSFTVGAGSTFPHCMQSEIANLSGSLTGRGNIQLGATSDGPSGADNFQGLGTVDGMRACSAGHYKPFNTKTVAYEDNVVSWPSVEPAADYTANSLLAFALAAGGHGHHGHRR